MFARAGVRPAGPRIVLDRTSLRNGVLGLVGMLAFYVTVVWWASGSRSHLVDQLARDWYLVAMVATAFGIQIALVSELRRRHRLHADAAAASGIGAGASTTGMIACCAHHVADLLPFVGLSGAATFLYDYRLLFVGAGLGINVLGIALAVRRLRALGVHLVEQGASGCAAVSSH